MTVALSIDYLTKQLAVCWTRAQLEAAAKEWPSANPPWAWWLGDRLASMSKPDALLRVQVALAHIQCQHIRAPARPGELWQFFKAASSAQIQAAGAALGDWLDTESPDAAAAVLAAMRGELAAAQGRVIEAAPPSSSSSADAAAVSGQDSPPPSATDPSSSADAAAASSTTTTSTSKRSKRP